MEFNPFVDGYYKDRTRDVIRACEYAYDLDSGNFLYDNGRMFKVYDNEALKIKLWKLFMSERYRWEVFPWDYGHELETLIGKAYTIGYINSEAKRYVEECIYRVLHDYIIKLEDLKIEFNNGTLFISFVAITIYGVLEIDSLKVRW